MSTEYFILVNNVQKGPYAADKLKSHGLKPDTLVWRKGLEHWVKARDEPELRRLFPWEPPKTAQPQAAVDEQSSTEKPSPPSKPQSVKSKGAGFKETLSDWADRFRDLAPGARYSIIGAAALLVVVPLGMWLFSGGNPNARYPVVQRQQDPKGKPPVKRNPQPKKTVPQRPGGKPAVVAGKKPRGQLPPGKFTEDYYSLARDLSLHRFFGKPRRGTPTPRGLLEITDGYGQLARKSKDRTIASLAEKAMQLWRKLPSGQHGGGGGTRFQPEALLIRYAGQERDPRWFEWETGHRKVWNAVMNHVRQSLDESVSLSPGLLRVRGVNNQSGTKPRIEATNISGRPLHHCTLEAALEAPWGLKVLNHYYFDLWNVDETLQLEPGHIWGHDGAAQTGVVTYKLWCDEGRTPTKRVKLEKQYRDLVDRALAYAEAGLERGSFHVPLKLSRGLAQGTEVDSADRAKARQLAALAEGIQRAHRDLMAAVVPEKTYTGRWWFGAYSGQIALRFEHAPQKGRPLRPNRFHPYRLPGSNRDYVDLTPAVKARVYDPRLPPEYKQLTGGIEFDPQRMDYVVRLKSGAVGVAGVATRTPSNTRNYLLKANARTWEFTARDGDLVGRLPTGDRLLLVPADHEKLQERLAALDGRKTAFPQPDRPQRITAVPASALPRLGEITPSPLRWSPGEIRRIGASGAGRKRVQFRKINQVLFSQTGTLAFVVESGQTFCLNAHGGQEKFRSPTGFPISVARTNQVIAVPTASGTRVFDGKTGEFVRRFVDRSSKVAAFSPDGQRLITGAEDGRLSVFARGGKRLMSVKHSNEVTALAVSPDGERAFSAVTDGSINVWDLTNDGKFLGAMRADIKITDLRVSPDRKLVLAIARVLTAARGRALATAQFEIQVWDVERKTRVFTGRVGREAACVDVSPDWRFALVGERNGPLVLWDLVQGIERCHLVGHTKPANSVRFSSDGRFAISGAYDGWVIIWGLPKDVFAGQREPPEIAKSQTNRNKSPARPLTPEQRRRADVMRTLKLAEAALQTGQRVRAARFLKQAEPEARKDPALRKELKRIRELF